MRMVCDSAAPADAIGESYPAVQRTTSRNRANCAVDNFEFIISPPGNARGPTAAPANINDQDDDTKRYMIVKKKAKIR